MPEDYDPIQCSPEVLNTLSMGAILFPLIWGKFSSVPVLSVESIRNPSPVQQGRLTNTQADQAIHKQSGILMYPEYAQVDGISDNHFL